LIEQEVTGVLVPPGNPIALAEALERLIGDPAQRARLGAAGERRVRRHFSMEEGIGVLAARFGLGTVASRQASCDRPVLPIIEGAAWIGQESSQMECVSPSMRR